MGAEVHGAALITGMFVEALRISGENGDARITRLDVEITPAGEVTEGEVRDRLFVLSQGTPVEGAEVIVTTCQRSFRCFSCGASFTSPETGPSAECPQCRHVAMCTDQSRDCVLAAVEIADDHSPAG